MRIILTTSRLYLRQFECNDAKNLFALNNDQEVIKYTGDEPFQSEADALGFINNYKHYDMHGFGRWSVVIKESDKFIGWCGLKLNEENDIDIGFRFFKKYWNQGYATESAKAVLDYGFNVLKIDTIIGRVAPKNIASVKILEKLGMEFKWRSNCHGIENARIYSISSVRDAF